jgi:oligopeptide/dipeptide ABC transporter ATP-binding protein
VEPILEIRDLAVGFAAPQGTLVALSGIDLRIENGSTVALLGESGSGKTILARSILRLLPAGGQQLSGEICLEGRDLSKFSEAEMDEVRGRRLAYVFQEPASALDPVRPVGSQVVEIVRLGRRVGADAARQRARDLLGSVGFPLASGGFDRYPHELSGGMRQRVVIAAALAGEPKLLLADEPTSSLDRSSELDLLDLFARIKREHGLSLIFITHDVAVARSLADRVVVLYAGRVVENAPAAAFFEAPLHPYSAALLRVSEARRRRVRGRLPAVGGTAPALAERLEVGCEFSPRCPEAFDRCTRETPGFFSTERAGVRCFLDDPGLKGSR